MGLLVKKTTQSKSKDRPLREQKNTQLRCQNQKCCHFFMGFSPTNSITFTKRFSLNCNYLQSLDCLSSFWFLVTHPETLVTSDDETESNRSTSSSSWDFGTPLARPKHFYRMPQNVIFFDTELIFFLKNPFSFFSLLRRFFCGTDWWLQLKSQVELD